MSEEARLLEKLKRIETILATADAGGERRAAAGVIDRLRERLAEARELEMDVEYRFAVPNAWSRHLFVALLRHYGLRPHSNRRYGRQTVIVHVPVSLMNKTIWPEFEQLDESLHAALRQASSTSRAKRLFRRGRHLQTAFVTRRMQIRVMRELSELIASRTPKSPAPTADFEPDDEPGPGSDVSAQST